MATFIQILLYLLVGFVEMFLATARTSFIAKGKNLRASVIVFVETRGGSVLYKAIGGAIGIRNMTPSFSEYGNPVTGFCTLEMFGTGPHTPP